MLEINNYNCTLAFVVSKFIITECFNRFELALQLLGMS